MTTLRNIRLIIATFFLVLASGFSGGMIAVYGQSADSDNPVITLDRPDRSYFFGDLMQNATAEKVITITNTGGSTLIIGQVQPDCGCTVVDVSNREIEPGESSTITVKLTVGRERGTFLKKMKIVSNDPMNSVITVVLQAKVTVLFDVEPHYIYLGEVRTAQLGKPRYLRLIGDDLKKTTITRIDPQSPYLDASYVSPGPESAERRIEVSLLPGAPLGQFNASLVLYTDHPEKTSVTISVHAFVLNNTIVRPGMVMFNISTTHPKPKRMITASNSFTPNFSISAAEILDEQPQIDDAQKKAASNFTFIQPSKDDLIIGIQPRDANGHIPISVVFNRTLKHNERIHGVIRLHTSDPLEPIVDVEYRAFFSGSSVSSP